MQQRRSDLCDLAESVGVDGAVFGDGYRAPSLVLWLAVPPASHVVGATASAPCGAAPAAHFLLGGHGYELLLYFDLLSLLLHLSLLVYPVDGLRALVASPGHPLALRLDREE